MLRLDRQPREKHGCREVQGAVHTAQAGKSLEPAQSQARPGAAPKRKDDRAWNSRTAFAAAAQGRASYAIMHRLPAQCITRQQPSIDENNDFTQNPFRAGQ